MGTIARMDVMLGLKSDDFDRGVKEAKSSTDSLLKGMSKVGAAMTGALTLPILGVAAASVKLSNDLNKSMANIGSLGIGTDRLKEMKKDIQDLSIEVGASTEDMADGMYQVVSAFGDGADSMKILRTNAKLAKAGLSSTSEAIALTSAVTKGYNDTSAEAVQHTADLAIQTVALGQTTFPELASAIGTVTPLAASLGVAQEDLFAVMATGAGVTGTSSQVATQFRGVLQSLMAPTDSMTKLFKKMGYSNGEAMLKGEGLQGTLDAIVSTAESAGKPLTDYIGSIEGVTLALALTDAQHATLTKNMTAMQNAAGMADEAFLAQTQGLNKVGFSMDQLQRYAEVLGQKLGDGLAPGLAIVLDKVMPLADGLVSLVDQFAKMDSNVQGWILAGIGLVAALGPLLLILPGIAKGVSMVAGAMAVMSGPIGLLIAAVIGLGLAWAYNWGNIQTKAAAVIEALRPSFEELQKWLDLAMKGDFSGLQAEIGAALTSVQVAVNEFDWADYITKLEDWSGYITKIDWKDYVTKLWDDYVVKLVWGDYVSKLNWGDYATKLDWTLWIPALVWSVVITPVRWATWIPQLLWDNVISKLSWSGFVTAITSWDGWVTMLQWSTLVLPVFWPAFIEKLGVTQWLAAIGESPQWTSFIEKLDWFAHIPGLNWPDWLTSLDWKTFIDSLVWPTITAPSWGSFIDKLKWPTIPSFPGWDAIVKGIFGTPGTGKVPDNVGSGGGGTPPQHGSTVTPYGGIGLPADIFHASGGLAKGLSVVGERGPELAFFGGMGADILSNPNSIKLLKMLGIPGFADGTGPVPPMGPQMAPGGYAVQSRPEGLFPPIMAKLTEAADAMGNAGESLTESATVMGESTEAFRSALQNVPGLFGTSEVTADQMNQAEMGIPQNFADNYLRRLTDEVVNGVDWEGVDIGDAAAAAGIDPNLPAEAILQLFKAAWNDSSLFANPDNLKFIDQSAVKEQIQKQQDQLAGQMNILGLFGIKDDSIAKQVQGLGTVLSTNFQDQMTPELFAPVGTKMVASMSGGFADAGAAGTASGNMIGAIQTALTQADMKDKLTTSGESAAAIYWDGWTNFFAKVQPPVPAPPGTTTPPTTPPGKATGGAVSSGVPYIVGERGQELFVPNVNGRIIPNSELGGMWDMASMGGGGPMIGVANVYNQVDLRALAYQVAEYQARRR